MLFGIFLFAWKMSDINSLLLGDLVADKQLLLERLQAWGFIPKESACKYPKCNQASLLYSDARKSTRVLKLFSSFRFICVSVTVDFYLVCRLIFIQFCDGFFGDFICILTSF